MTEAPDDWALLDTQGVRAMDAAAASVDVLMERAGAACAEALMRRWSGGAVLVLCGSGGNGGDGYGAARHIVAAGGRARVAVVSDKPPTGAAAQAKARWEGASEAFAPDMLDGADCVLDAMVGVGLTRPLAGKMAQACAALRDTNTPVLAVDMPSGISADSGAVVGDAHICATATITFELAKAGHWLMPGRLARGALEVASLGVPASALAAARGRLWLNHPRLWPQAVAYPNARTHKWQRGHAMALSGDKTHTGAVRLVARAALRAGAGLATIAASGEAVASLAPALEAVMLAQVDDSDGLEALLARVDALAIGPACGVGSRTRAMCRRALAHERRALAHEAREAMAVVLDADALTSFRAAPDALFALVRGADRGVVLTPHEGEFARLFPDLGEGAKVARVRMAARRSGAVVVLKGPDTVISAPDGRSIIQGEATPWLATAGSGDVLTGIVLGLLAKGIDPFSAAAAAVWLHAEAGAAAGVGLIADDLPEALPEAWEHAHSEARL